MTIKKVKGGWLHGDNPHKESFSTDRIIQNQIKYYQSKLGQIAYQAMDNNFYRTEKEAAQANWDRALQELTTIISDIRVSILKVEVERKLNGIQKRDLVVDILDVIVDNAPMFIELQSRGSYEEIINLFVINDTSLTWSDIDLPLALTRCKRHVDAAVDKVKTMQQYSYVSRFP